MRKVAALSMSALVALAISSGVVETSGAGRSGEAADSRVAFGPWSPAVSVEAIPGTHPELNTGALEGCPAISWDGLELYMASNRPHGQGGIDIWVARRDSVSDGWGEPINLGPDINTSYDEFCPTPVGSHGLLFVSTRPACGGADMYATSRIGQRGWHAPYNLGCHVNSAADEASPFLVFLKNGTIDLYFSSTRAGGYSTEGDGPVSGDGDIYVSAVHPNGQVDAPELVPGINTEAQDLRPNVRSDGLEIFFDSNRSGSEGADIWSATRPHPWAAWNAPVNAGGNVNGAANETRAFLSRNGRTLYFGSNRAGTSDLYYSTRDKVPGNER